MPLISWYPNYIYCWLYSSYILHKKFNQILQDPYWPFVSFWNLKSLCFTCCHSFSFVEPLAVIRFHSLYHSLSFAITHFHLLSLFVLLVAIRCTARCHSLSLVVTLVVTRCTTHLSFYKTILPLYIFEKIWENLIRPNIQFKNLQFSLPITNALCTINV